MPSNYAEKPLFGLVDWHFCSSPNAADFWFSPQLPVLPADIVRLKDQVNNLQEQNLRNEARHVEDVRMFEAKAAPRPT